MGRGMFNFCGKGCQIWTLSGPEWYQIEQIGQLWDILRSLKQKTYVKRPRFVQFEANLTQIDGKSPTHVCDPGAGYEEDKGR